MFKNDTVSGVTYQDLSNGPYPDRALSEQVL